MDAAQIGRLLTGKGFAADMLSKALAEYEAIGVWAEEDGGVRFIQDDD